MGRLKASWAAERELIFTRFHEHRDPDLLKKELQEMGVDHTTLAEDMEFAAEYLKDDEPEQSGLT
jgi:hypothetical protein